MSLHGMSSDCHLSLTEFQENRANNNENMSQGYGCRFQEALDIPHNPSIFIAFYLALINFIHVLSTLFSIRIILSFSAVS